MVHSRVTRLARGAVLSALLRAVQYAVVFPLGSAFGGWRLVGGTDVEGGKSEVESDGTDTDVESGKSKVGSDGNGKDVETRGTDVESRK